MSFGSKMSWLKSKIEIIFSQYKNIFDSFSAYWRSYGGSKALILSPYLHCSIIFSLFAYPIWFSSERDNEFWYELTLSTLPDILGFTLGGFALLLAFGDDKFRKLLSGNSDDGSVSPFMGVSAAFTHFILVQIFAIILAILGYTWNFKYGLFAWFGFTALIYSLMTAIAATLAILRYAGWFDKFTSKSD